MKYEKLHGHVFICAECCARGRFRWWWNRRNGMDVVFKRFCKKCGRKRRYKLINGDLNEINLGFNKRKKEKKILFNFFDSPFTHPKKYRGLE